MKLYEIISMVRIGNKNKESDMFLMVSVKLM